MSDNEPEPVPQTEDTAPEPVQEPEPEPELELEPEPEPEDSAEDEDPGDGEDQGFSNLIPQSLVDSIRQQVESKGSEILNQHKDLVQSLATQVSGHAQTIQELQGHIAQLRDMKTNPKSAFLKAGYQIMQDQGLN